MELQNSKEYSCRVYELKDEDKKSNFLMMQLVLEVSLVIKIVHKFLHHRLKVQKCTYNLSLLTTKEGEKHHETR
jgi:hypothetical protein